MRCRLVPGMWIVSLSLALAACRPAGAEAAATLPAPTWTLAATSTLTVPPPAEGEWGGPTDFGRLVITVAPGGEMLSKIRIQMSKWKCRSDVMTSGTVEMPGAWPISGGAFSASHIDLGFGVMMDLSGAYEPASQTFSGKWSAASPNCSCSGMWEAAALGPGTATPTATSTPTPVFTPVPGLDQAVLQPADLGPKFSVLAAENRAVRGGELEVYETLYMYDNRPDSSCMNTLTSAVLLYSDTETAHNYVEKEKRRLESDKVVDLFGLGDERFAHYGVHNNLIDIVVVWRQGRANGYLVYAGTCMFTIEDALPWVNLMQSRLEKAVPAQPENFPTSPPSSGSRSDSTPTRRPCRPGEPAGRLLLARTKCRCGQ